MAKNKLTTKQILFCKHFLATNSVSIAHRLAGYVTCNGSNDKGSKTFNLPHVKEYIEELSEYRNRRLEISADRVLQEIAKIAFVDPTEIFSIDKKGNMTFEGDLKDLKPEERACIAEVTVANTKYGKTTRIKLHDKLSALEKLGKNLKLFTDVTEHQFSVTQMGEVKMKVIGEGDGEETVEALDFDIGVEANKIDKK